MKSPHILVLALFALVSLGTLAACDAEKIEEQTKSALDSVKDANLDGIKKQFNDLGIAKIEAKARELGKLDIPEVKNLLAKKVDFQKLLDGIGGGEGMMEKIKELTPKLTELKALVEKAKTALGM